MDLVLRQTLIVMVIGMLVPIGAISFASLLVSFVQSITQIQEQSLSFFVKLVTLLLLLYFTAPVLEQQVLQLTTQSLAAMVNVK